MNSIKNRLIDYFTKRVFELYEVTGNHAHFLFDRWNVTEFSNESDVEVFLNGDDVKNVFFITADINIVKKYTIEELKKLNINFTQVIDSKERIFKDDKHGFTWQELFHGMGDCWTGLYVIRHPLLSDEHLCKPT